MEQDNTCKPDSVWVFLSRVGEIENIIEKIVRRASSIFLDYSFKKAYSALGIIVGEALDALTRGQSLLVAVGLCRTQSHGN
jgi:hypothetical protein